MAMMVSNPGGAGYNGKLMLRVRLCAGGEHKFLCDHVIEGRILMPATSYVATAWEALCIIKSRKMEETPVTFEDVIIRQAVTAEEGQKVLLGVLFAPNHHFCVSVSVYLYFMHGSMRGQCLVAVMAGHGPDASLTGFFLSMPSGACKDYNTEGSNDKFAAVSVPF